MNPPTDLSSPWKTIEPGVEVLRLWESTGPKQPQIAILQLSNEKYKELKKNVKAFMDSRNIYYEPVRPGAKLVEMLKPPPKYAGTWVVSGPHLESKCRCASYPAEHTELKKT